MSETPKIPFRTFVFRHATSGKTPWKNFRWRSALLPSATTPEEPDAWTLFPDGLMSLNQGGIIERANPTLEGIFQYGYGELTGKHFSVLLSPRPDLRHKKLFERFLQAPRPLSFRGNLPFPAVRKNGQEFPVAITVTPWGTGEQRIFVGVRDISLDETLEQDSRRQGVILRSIIDNLPAQVAIREKSGKYYLVNRKFEDFFRLSREEIIGKRPKDLFPERLAKQITELDARLSETQLPFPTEETITYQGSHRNFLSFRFLLPVDPSDGPLLCTIRTDITEKKTAENALGDLAAIVASSEDAIFSLSPEGRILTCNRASSELFGYPADEMVGKSAFMLVPLGRGKELQDHLKAVRHGVRVPTFETVQLRKDGTHLPVSVSLWPVSSSDGTLSRISWICRDISEQTKSKALLHQFSRVIEQTADLVMITDRAGSIEYVNSSFERITGFTREEVLGKKPGILKSGFYAEDFYKGLWDKILSGQPFQQDLVSRKKDGSLYHTEKTITPLKDEEGNITHFVSTDKDITEKKAAEKEFYAMLNRFREIFDFSSDALAYCRLDGTFIDVNNAFCRLTGYSKDELVGHKMYQDITPKENAENGNQLLANLVATGDPVEYEKEYLRKEGTRVPVLLTAFPLRTDLSTHAIGVIAKDITERKRHENEMRALTEELKRSNSDLQRFAYVASHDLQEPLRTIGSFLQLLGEKADLDGEAKTYLKFVIDASKRLKDLIRDILELSRIDGAALGKSSVNCEAALATAIANLEGAIGESHAKITHSPLPTLVASPSMIALLLQNLLGNAIKFRRPAEVPAIHVEASLQDGTWVFSVSDNGIGIPADKRDCVFLTFRRLNADYPGTGIGLSICKRIVEGHGGKIWVDANARGGSTFYFSLPSSSSSSESNKG